MPRAGRLDEGQRVQLYTGGLLPPLSHAVRIHNSESLAGAMSLACQVEQMELARLPPPAGCGAPRALLPAPAPKQPLLTLPAPPATAAQPRQDGPPLKRLSPEEQAERRRLGLCFNCNDAVSASASTAMNRTPAATTASAATSSTSTASRSRLPTRNQQGTFSRRKPLSSHSEPWPMASHSEPWPVCSSVIPCRCGLPWAPPPSSRSWTRAPHIISSPRTPPETH